MNRIKWVSLSAAIVLAGCTIGGGGGGTSGEMPPITPIVHGTFTVLAWNDLGMHCINPTYDKIMVLPPFNNLHAQVIQRGDPPVILITGITVEYSIQGNTYSSGKRAYGGFWGSLANSLATLMGLPTTTVPVNVGLTGNGLSGTMVASGDHFEATGIPVIPVLDSGTWNPYQVGIITVKDGGGAVIAQTHATVPISDEMSCADCHGKPGTYVPGDPFADILATHNANHTSVTITAPVTCASCHGDPALGLASTGGNKTLSLAMHGWHSTYTPQPTCYQCHPGPVTQCSRSTRHTASDGNCAACHGTLADMAAGLAGGRTPWAQEPKCVTCHTGVAEVDTGGTLYRQAMGHGGLECAACHGSPHAMIPTNQVPGYPNVDAYQEQQVQGFTTRVKSIGSCGVCHNDSRGPSEIGDYAEEHGGSHPQQANGCNACHVSTPTTTVSWPHAHQWKNSN